MINIRIYFCLILITSTSLNAGIFPVPSGPFGVGTQDFYVVDNTTDLSRELMIQFWYPSVIPITHNEVATALYESNDFKFVLSQLTKGNYENLDLSKLKEMKTFAIFQAPPMKDMKFPVILFSHGLGMDRRTVTGTCEDLASHGFVIVGIDHTNYAGSTTFPNGTNVVFKRTEFYSSGLPHEEIIFKDVEIVISKLRMESSLEIPKDLLNLLNMDRIGIFGHSFGGANSVRLLLRKPEVKAALSLDGRPLLPTFRDQFAIQLEKPLMVLMGENINLLKNIVFEKEEDHPDFPEVKYYNIPTGGIDVQLVSIQRAQHQTFTDRTLIRKAIRNLIPLSSETDLTYLDKILLTGNSDEKRASQIVTSHILSFFQLNL